MDHKTSTESGYESQTSSRADIRWPWGTLTYCEGGNSTSILHPSLIEELEEPKIIPGPKNAACEFRSPYYDPLLSGVQQDACRGSAESNPSCSSFASTPASTRPLLADQSLLDQSRRSSLRLNLRDDSTQTQALQQMPKLPSDLAKLNYADEIVLRDTVRREMPIFVNNTDFQSISSYLYSRKLLHTSDYTTLVNMLSDKERRNRLYMQILPTKGRHTYRRLYECLKDEVEHTGHKDLVEVLDKALKDRYSSADNSPTDHDSSQCDKLPSSSRARTCKLCCVVQ